ncbi:MAG: SDR family NAD(P)-dependent oxidoreductase [Candidatus Binatus sp.]|uniref:SDR family NAD(P)-dependent oxidoreductase n=1 Tax=Candidatus Binatus sp. TaxID=2811406 RepID=UPI0027167D24|nr:SDR family NAD(P)-dependent oxidoreductase [Candidatus Binatus sp.]MDO8432244.1 SDR family NAD(P)-dependent oxidoreductase [Candidatus Binatus sp.]
MQQLENRVAIITGGTGALGRAVSENFLTAGARVAIPWVVEAEVPMLEAQLGNRFPSSATFLKKADVCDEKLFGDFAAEVESKWGKIDILVNLVGGFWGGSSIAQTSMAEWQAMFDLNVKPTFICCKTVAPIMQKNKWGRIVSVTSRTGLLGAGDYAAYAVAKGAIATFTVSLAEELLADGVMVNAIAPSTIDTEANRKAMPNAKHEKWVKPEDIARTLNFLCSDDCRVTSGAIVPVYGKA